jgi:hypothetical protein
MLVVFLLLTIIGLGWLVLRLLDATTELARHQTGPFEARNQINQVERQTIDAMVRTAQVADDSDIEEHWLFRSDR